MKKIIFFAVVIMSIIISCTKQEDEVLQDAGKELIGTWTVFEMTYLINQDTIIMTEDTLEKYGLFEDYFFMEDSKFKQTGNLGGDEPNGPVTTQEGIWKINENKMTATIKVGEQWMNVYYTWVLQDQNLYLTLTFPDRRVVLALRKKI